MKALFCTSRSDDYISAVVFDGLQDLLGWENVSEAGFAPWLHDYTNYGSSTWRVGGHRIGRCLDHNDRDYDILVLNAALLRDHDWHFPTNLRDNHCKPGAKIAFIDGGDDWNSFEVPPFPIDGYFRREIVAGAPYRLAPHHLTFAAPLRWLDGSDRPERTYDVFAVNPYHSFPSVRWEHLPWLWRTQKKHISIACSGGLTHDRWFDYLRDSKLAICCAGGAGSDSMKFAEVPACGAIPIFLGIPPKVRENWYVEGEHAFFCDTVEGLPDVIDRALGSDLDVMRTRLLAHVRQHFTTKTMVTKMLKVVGLA